MTSLFDCVFDGSEQCLEGREVNEELLAQLCAFLRTLADNRADLAVTSPVQQGVDERLGLITGSKPCCLHIGSVNVTLDDLSCVSTVISEEVGKATKFESGQVSTD